MNRVGHFFLTALTAGAGIAAEMLAQPVTPTGHGLAWAPLALAGVKWIHHELTRLAGGKESP